MTSMSIQVHTWKPQNQVKNRLAKIVANYNNQIHRGIGMSPNEAQKEQNRTKVLENSKKYKKEFIEKDLPKYNIGDRVLIKKDVRNSKDDRHFEKEAENINILGRDTYSVITPARERLTKHFSQLKLL